MKYIIDIPDNVDYGVLTCKTNDGYYTHDFEIAELEQLPPASNSEFPNNSDTISRKAVTDVLNNIEIPRNASWYPYYQQALTAVDKLPPAQPKKRTEERTETHACDSISRQAAIDAVNNLTYPSSLVDVKRILVDLPSAQPAQPTQLEQCPIYGGMCAYPSDQCYDCPRHAGAKMERGATA